MDISLEEQYGYDGNFVSDVPAFLKCVVCHLVMRQPVQVMTCGHRFCKACFNRIEGYSKHLNTIFCCPIDRETIDMSKVFDDTACSRDIGNLDIACSYSPVGCLWVGDLRSLVTHEKDCQYRPKVTSSNQISDCKSEDALMKEILRRLRNCEDSLIEKEKDISNVSFDIREMKNNLEKKDEELNTFKIFNLEIQTEMKQVKKFNEELEIKYGKEIEILKEQNKTLQNKVESLDVKLVKSINVLKDDEVLRRKMESVNINSNKNLTSCQKEIENVKSLVTTSIPSKEDFTKLDGEVKKTCKEIRSLRSHTDKSLNKKTNAIMELTNRVKATEELIEDVTAEVGNLTEKSTNTKTDNKVKLINREMKNNAEKNGVERNAFKVLNLELQTEMKQLKKSNEVLEIKYGEEIKTLKEQNKTLQEKVESFDAKLAESINVLKDNEVLKKKLESISMNSSFIPKILDIADDDIVKKFCHGVSNVAALSLSIGYPTIASAHHSVANGFKNIAAVRLEADLDIPQIHGIKEFLADPSKFVTTAAPVEAIAPAAEAKGETKKYESDESGLDDNGLFD